MITIDISHTIYTSEGAKDLLVNKTVREGALVQLSGLSGIGKTTLFRILVGLIKPDRGFFRVGDKILLNTEKNINLPPQQRNIALMFQEYTLFPNMTVWENIAFAQKQKDPAYISQLLKNFKMEQLKNRKVTQLSGGQQQRVALVRTLAQKASITLLDEPFSSVDATMRAIMKQEVLSFLTTTKSTIFIISHQTEDFEKEADDKIIITNTKDEEQRH